MDLFYVTQEEISKKVENFFYNIKTTQPEFTDPEFSSDDRQKLLDLDMKLQTKNLLLESYAKEIESLQDELKLKEEDNTQRELQEMHEDIKLLNDTIESLQYENTKLKDAMLSLNHQTVEDNKNSG